MPVIVPPDAGERHHVDPERTIRQAAPDMSRQFEPLTPHSHLGGAIDWNDPSQQAIQNEEIEADELIDVAELKAVPRDALKILLRFLIPADSLPRKKWRVAQMRLATIAYLANVDEIGGQTLTEIAEELQCTRALVSLYHVRMCDALGIGESRAGKKRSSRETFRQSATSAHERAGHKMKTTAPTISTGLRSR